MKPIIFELEDSDIQIQHRGDDSWAIINVALRNSFNHSGQWEREPFPSNRTDEYIQSNRYISPEAADAHYRKYKK